MSIAMTAEPSKFVLWFRASRHQRWRAVASAATQGELTEKQTTMPNGDFIVTGLDRDPNQKPRARA